MVTPNIPGVPERICKPRQTHYKHLPVIAVDLTAGMALDDNGELLDLEEVTTSLPTRDSCVIVGKRVQDYVALLQERFPVGFQYRAQVPGAAEKFANGYATPLGAATVTLQYFGWRWPGRSSEHYNYRNHHLPLDPVTFYSSSFDLAAAMGYEWESP